MKIEQTDNVLDDLRTRVATLEEAEGEGYGPCLMFYMRIINEIEGLEKENASLSKAVSDAGWAEDNAREQAEIRRHSGEQWR